MTLPDNTGEYRAIFVKPADVAVYVEHGIADCGIVGHDIILESEPDVLLPLDLAIARCQLVVAGIEGESFESAMRRFKKVCEKTGILSEMRKYEHYEKPSVKRKKKAIAAKKRAVKKLRKGF